MKMGWQQEEKGVLLQKVIVEKIYGICPNKQEDVC